MQFKYFLVIFIFLLPSSTLFAADKNQQYHEVIGLHESLYNAIKMDSVQEIKQFIEFGADINHRYVGGKTPLMFATSLGNINSVQTLIELGAQIKLKSDDDMTAYDYANTTNNFTLAEILNTNPSKQNKTNRQTISTIQFYLNRLGYVAGDVDGIFGEKTRSSLKKFSIDSKQAFPAEISDRQIEILFHKMSENNIDKKIDADSEAKSNIEYNAEIIQPISAGDLAISDAEHKN